MAFPAKPLGILRPLGGGDPIPLTGDELIIGRRPSCDIRLEFENVSGKHCMLMFIRGVWHVRDLISTNGTFLNNQKVDQDRGVMPDDVLRLATHSFTIDYEPAVSGALVDSNQVLEEEIAQAAEQLSLQELADFGSGPDTRPRTKRPGPRLTPERGVRPAAPEPSRKDSTPDSFKTKPAEEPVQISDDDFFDIIKSDLDDEDNRRQKGRGRWVSTLPEHGASERRGSQNEWRMDHG